MRVRIVFPDRKLFKRSGSGFNLYTSAELSRLWPYGHASVGDLSFESAAYVARYCVKKSEGVSDVRLMRHDEYGVAYWLTPEFSRFLLSLGLVLIGGVSILKRFLLAVMLL